MPPEDYALRSRKDAEGGPLRPECLYHSLRIPARLLGSLSALAPKTRRQFPEIDGDIHIVAVPARHGEVRCTVYRPPIVHRRSERRHYRLASAEWETNGNGIEGIAPELVISAERDRLRGEAAALARKLDVAGSVVEYRDVPGVDHGYNIVGDSEDITLQIYDFIVDHVVRSTTEEKSRFPQ